MTDRLDQIEAILASVAQQQQQAQVELAETRQIVDSTARSVAANSDQIAANSELITANARLNAELDQRLASVARTAEANANATTETRMMVAAGFEATRQAFAETREGIDDVVRMVTTTSAEAQADRQRFDAWLVEAQNDRQRFDAWLVEAQADRQRNDQAHRAFTESFQSLLAEIARIWQRLSA